MLHFRKSTNVSQKTFTCISILTKCIRWPYAMHSQAELIPRAVVWWTACSVLDAVMS